MINDLVVEIFRRVGLTWKVGGKQIQPDEKDVEIVLDAIAAKLYDEKPETTFTTNGLVVEKTERGGYDVYAYIGTYY